MKIFQQPEVCPHLLSALIYGHVWNKSRKDCLNSNIALSFSGVMCYQLLWKFKRAVLRWVLRVFMLRVSAGKYLVRENMLANHFVCFLLESELANEPQVKNLIID